MNRRGFFGGLMAFVASLFGLAKARAAGRQIRVLGEKRYGPVWPLWRTNEEIATRRHAARKERSAVVRHAGCGHPVSARVEGQGPGGTVILFKCVGCDYVSRIWYPTDRSGLPDGVHGWKIATDVPAEWLATGKWPPGIWIDIYNKTEPKLPGWGPQG